MAQSRKWQAVGGQAGVGGRTEQVSTSGAELSGVFGTRSSFDARFLPALHRFKQHQVVLLQGSRTANVQQAGNGH